MLRVTEQRQVEIEVVLDGLDWFFLRDADTIENVVVVVVDTGTGRLRLRRFESVLDLFYIVLPVFFFFIWGSSDEE